MSRATIGFIGLGIMGTGFTRRLKASGWRVVGYDIAADKVRAAAAHGVEPADSPAAVARAADIVLVCVVSTAAVEEVALGKGGLIETPGKGKVAVDHSTTEIDATKRIAATLADRTGLAWVDGPVSGGPAAAEQGALAIMAGGTDAAIARVSPVMKQLASRFTHMGPSGAGQATKMINQVLVLTNYCVLAEAMRLGEACGVDVAKVPEALATGHAGSTMLKDIFPRMLARDFAPRGYARQVLKDLDMVQDLAAHMKVPTPMATMAGTLFRLLVSRGHSELDASAILKLYMKEPL